MSCIANALKNQIYTSKVLTKMAIYLKKLMSVYYVKPSLLWVILV